MTDLIQEIYGTIMRNKLRTILTGFSVAWGIFMLIVLLGAGNGLIHAFEGQSQNMKMNSIKIYPGYTSKPFNGLKEGRRLSLNESDLQLTAEAFPDKVITTGASISKSDAILTFGKEHVSISLEGVFPNYTELEAVKLKQGRFINDRDMKERRKMIVLHEKTVKMLFPRTQAIGKYIDVQGVAYQVIGIYTDQNSFSPSALVPFTTLQLVYGKGDSIDNLTFTTQGLTDEVTNEKFEQSYRRAMGLHKNFDPTDQSAIWMWNPLHSISPARIGSPYAAHSYLGNRYIHPAERHRGGKQYHAYHRTRTYPRVRHPESSGSQTDVYPVAHYLGECGHHYFFRLYRHGGRHCRHRIYESDSRQTDRRCGCVQRNGFRKPDSRPQHSCSGHTHTDNRRHACRTLSGT